jgi:Ca2+/Na+ antiporter
VPVMYALVSHSYPREPFRIDPPRDYTESLAVDATRLVSSGLVAIYFLQSAFRLQAAVEDDLSAPQKLVPRAARAKQGARMDNTLAAYRFVVDGRYAGRRAAATVWMAAQQRSAIAASLLALSLGFLAVVMAAAGGPLPRWASIVIALVSCFVVFIRPLLRYRSVRRTQSRASQVGGEYESAFNATEFSITTPEGTRTFPFRSFETVTVVRRFVFLERFNLAGRIILPSELFPDEQVGTVRAAIQARRDRGLARGNQRVIPGEPESYEYRFIANDRTASRWATARLRRKLVSTPHKIIIFWATVLLILTGLALLAWPGLLPKWASLPLIVASAYSLYVNYFREHRTLARRLRAGLAAGELWESSFGSAEIWLRTPRSVHRYPYASFAEVTFRYGFAFINRNDSALVMELPVDLFPPARAARVLDRATNRENAPLG